MQVERFLFLQEGVLSSLSNKGKESVRNLDNLSNQIFKNKSSISDQELMVFCLNHSDKLLKCIGLRILLVDHILKKYEKTLLKNEKIDINKAWEILYESFQGLPESHLIASIGSQGFLSIPIYHSMKSNNFNFIRLHIWDESLDKHLNLDTYKQLSIHSHQFHAQSWILTGEIYNKRFDVNKVENQLTDYNYFDIQWNNSENTVNRKTSIAVNTRNYVEVLEKEVEVYKSEDTYSINAGEFHESRAKKKNCISSTLFIFSTHKGRVPTSHVLGPSNIEYSEINRKVQVNFSPLLDKLNSAINNG